MYVCGVDCCSFYWFRCVYDVQYDTADDVDEDDDDTVTASTMYEFRICDLRYVYT